MADETPLSVHEPVGRVKGGVVVVQEAFGVTDHIEDIGRRLAAAGWLAVAPHLFHRAGDPTYAYDDRSAWPTVRSLTAEGILEDLDAAFARIDAAGIAPDGTGIVGFCMGGTVAFVAACERTVGASVTFYGGGVREGRFGFPALVDIADRLEAPWLGLYGDEDTGIPVDDVEALRKAAVAAPVPTEVVRYPHAGHAFNRDGTPPYHEPSATDAWARTLAWFDRYLTPSPA
jgi:carboxymethylenebutenolidase